MLFDGQGKADDIGMVNLIEIVEVVVIVNGVESVYELIYIPVK